MSEENAIQITSSDINPAKFSVENVVLLRKTFPELDDDLLAMYLVSRNDDVAEAAKLIEKYRMWKASDAYPILKSSVYDEISKGKLYMYGHDKEGHPLMVWSGRKHFAKDRDMNTTTAMVVWWMCQVVHRMPPGKTKFTVLIDRTDYKMENQDFELAKRVSSQFQDLFPERMFRTIVYPSGLMFYGAWNIIKWFLDPVTREKVSPVVTLAGVQQFVDDEFIPKSMGGKSEYVFSPDDFDDPYTPEEIEAASQRSRPADLFGAIADSGVQDDVDTNGKVDGSNSKLSGSEL